ncbi:MAG: hypothetical protein AAGC76_11325 [Luteibacter sp.]|uniref:hypothetical protein n=1 Tax=Luteibacter sp. TaxID=1886636 RepID=UPI002808BE0B|nr:hypothetical protein [Luteibacter sp.]MDQ7996432.1 hypothetical protein [Luteibacter sp.]MDQ8047940.1 hypothetical protein [Luteibacter sp.]
MSLTSDTSKASRRGAITIAAVVFFATLITRVCFASLYASDTPFWDQWDGELAVLLKSWVDGTLSMSDLFSSHNEHRIVVTRLLILGIFEINGHRWSNLVEAYTNAVIASSYLALVAWLLIQRGRSLQNWTVLLLVGSMGILPFGWENFLVGFQSQFYFMALFAIAMVALAAFRPGQPRTAFIVTILGLAGLFTTGAGLVAAIAVIFILGLKAYQERAVARTDRLTMALMLLIIAIAASIARSVPGHEVLKPVGLEDNVRALLTALMWPIQPAPGQIMPLYRMMITAAVMWAPSVVWLIRFVRHRRARTQEFFAIGLAAWGFIQAAAIAHSRGHYMLMLASRYMDISALALIANAWLAAHLMGERTDERKQRILVAAVAVVFACVTARGLTNRTGTDVASMIERGHLSLIETRNVTGYAASGNPAWLDQPGLEIPYPQAKRLRELLDDPTISSILPPSMSRMNNSHDDDLAVLSSAAEPFRSRIRAFVFHLLPRLQPAPLGPLPTNVITEADIRKATDLPVVEGKAYCVLDQINEKAPNPGKVEKTDGTLQIRGWAVPSLEKNAVGERLWVELTDTKHQRQLRLAQRVPRPDVADSLKQSEFVNSGFDARISTEGLAYPIKVRLLQEYERRALACSNETFDLEPAN